MKKLTRRDFASGAFALGVMAVAGEMKRFHTEQADDDNNFQDIRVGFNEAVNFNGHVFTVTGYEVGRDVRNQYAKSDKTMPTKGLWFAFRFVAENWALETTRLSGGGLRYADGTFAERSLNDGYAQQPYGVREFGYTLVEVNPDKLEGAVLEIYPYEIITGYRRRAIIDLGFDRAVVERLKATPADAVIDFDVLGRTRQEGM